MGRLGDLLELIESAPVAVRTLTGSLWRWTHYERSRRAFEEVARSGGGSVSRMALAVGSGPVPDERDEHLHIWLDLPARWRVESADRLDLKDGDRRWTGTFHRFTALELDDSRIDQTEVGLLMEPRAYLLGGLRFGTPVEDRIDGRPCWKSDASSDVRSGPGRIGMRLGGVDHAFWFDVETGIVMRHVGLVDGEPCSIAEFKDVVVNQPIPDETFHFTPPPDSVVERQIDVFLHMAEMRGVDLSGVDRSDFGAVRAALENMGRPHHPLPESRQELQRAKHIPVDFPPADEAAARSAIEYAYANYVDTDETGGVLVNIQGGRGLAEYLQQAGQRIPGSPQGEAKLVVDDVKFLRPDEAVVWFSLEINGNRLGFVNGREGRAVLCGGRWMIEHATIVDLIGMAGIVVPPPSK